MVELTVSSSRFTRPLATFGLSLAITLTASACVSSTDDDDRTPAPAAGPLAGVPDLNSNQRGDLSRRLAAIDKNLVADLDLAVTRARYVCKQILEGQLSAEKLDAFAIQQYLGGEVSGITPDGASSIVAATKAAFCPDPNAAPAPSAGLNEPSVSPSQTQTSVTPTRPSAQPSAS